MLDYQFETGDIAVFFTLILLEGVLAFDNAAILAAMTRRLPEDQRRKALLYGLAGAYVFRVGAIFAVAWLAENTIVKLLGGLYLVFLSVKHLLPGKTHKEESPKWAAALGITGFWAIVIQLEITDLVFAIDQVLVAVALTDKLVLIIAASLIAIVMLRFSALYIGRIMDWFPRLEMFAYLAVGLVGVKLVWNQAVTMASRGDWVIPKAATIIVTLSLLLVPILVKLIVQRASSDAK